MEFETFDGEELNSVLETLGHSSDSETEISRQVHELDHDEEEGEGGNGFDGGRLGYDTKNERAHAHYRLIDNEEDDAEEDENNLDLADSLTPSTIHYLTDRTRNDTKGTRKLFNDIQ